MFSYILHKAFLRNCWVKPEFSGFLTNRLTVLYVAAVQSAHTDSSSSLTDFMSGIDLNAVVLYSSGQGEAMKPV